MSDPILVATSGRPDALGALRLARSLQRRDGRAVEVIAVAEPVILYGLASGMEGPAEGYAMVERLEAERVRFEVEAQLAELGPEARDWTLFVEVGAPAVTIARHARRRGISTILLGIGPRNPLDHWIRSETANKVVRIASVPVVAVHQEAEEAPTGVLVGVDFSAFSADAAHAALELLPDDGAVHLVHVTWLADSRPGEPSAVDEFKRTYDEGAKTRLERLGEELSAACPGLRVETHVVAGDPGPALLEAAERLEVELVAVGSHGYGFLGRALLGSVSTKLIRGSRGAVLLSPPHDPAPELDAEPAGEGMAGAAS